MVFVLGTNKKPQNPVHPAEARKLLSTGKAAVWRMHPFTIILKPQEQKTIDEYRLKVDYGSKGTGLAILQYNKVVWLGVLKHRTNIKKRMEARRGHRRFRRNKLRYRKPRFNNRTGKWRRKLPPSLQSRVDNVEHWVKRLIRFCPITAISFEENKFDQQLMRNPEISGIEYQQGTLQGYEIREYLLEKFNRTCVYCKKKDIPLEVEHVIPKCRGGTDRVDNLAISCKDCNRKKGKMTAEEFGHPDVQKQVKKTLKDAAIVNATRQAVLEALQRTGLPVECGTGARTKMNRIKQGLPKEHYFDACCVGASTPDKLIFCTKEVQIIEATGRGRRQIAILNKHGFPRGHKSRKKFYFGFQTGDMIKVNVAKGKNTGTYTGRVACRASGRFSIKTKYGLIDGIRHKYCTKIQNNDGYDYKMENIRDFS